MLIIIYNYIFYIRLLSQLFFLKTFITSRLLTMWTDSIPTPKSPAQRGDTYILLIIMTFSTF